MLTANQQQLAQIWPFLDEQPLVLLDWLPWNHTFGANHNFNLVLRHAGTLTIDGGRPVPGLIEQTARNLSEVAPTVYFNVPAGYAALLPFLERDEALARSFFGKLRLIFYAGAALPQDLWTRLEAVSMRATGERVPMTSSWGTTETSPMATAAHVDHRPRRPDRRAGAGRRAQARARGRQARGAGARPERDAGLLEASRPHRRGVRRGRLLQAGRRGAARSIRPIPGRASYSTAG